MKAFTLSVQPAKRVGAGCPAIARRLAIALFIVLTITVTHAERVAPEFDGITTNFKLTRSRIKTDQTLKVRIRFHNGGTKPTVFRFYEPSAHARLYRGGKDLGLLCATGDHPVFSVLLKPGGAHKTADELYITQCYHLTPGVYAIRFNYTLTLLRDEVRRQYESKYHHPDLGLVSWDGREHSFTVVK